MTALESVVMTIAAAVATLQLWGIAGSLDALVVRRFVGRRAVANACRIEDHFSRAFPGERGPE